MTVVYDDERGSISDDTSNVGISPVTHRPSSVDAPSLKGALSRLRYTPSVDIRVCNRLPMLSEIKTLQGAES